MKSYVELPEGYKEIYSVDLQKNKKIAVLINSLAVLICVAMIIPVHFIVPITSLFDMSDGLGMYFIKLVAMFGGMVIYMILHEFVHGITMRLSGTKKVKYGFTGMYAYAGSDDFYDKRTYIIIALAPVVVWGVVLAILNMIVPESWFWVVYFIQLTNISGAAGDYFVSCKFSKLPSDIIVRDYGVGMKVYSRNADL